MIDLKKFFLKEQQDTVFLLYVLLLLGMGLIMLYSASFPSAYYETGDAAYYFKHQLRYAILGVASMVIMSKFDYHYLRYFSAIIMVATFILLGAVRIPGIGVVRNNARRWLMIGGLSFQPSELAKLAIIIDFSASIARKKEYMKTFRYGIFPYLLRLAPVCFLIYREPHLSGAILVAGIGAALLFVGGIRWRWVVLGLGAVALFITALLNGWIDYNQSRIAMWHDPFIDASGAGYQLSQSIITIGSGGLLGLGLGQGRQKFRFLPEEHNDFIFAIVCEELGLIGATLIMAVFAVMIVRGYQIARAAKDRFGSLLAVGVTTHFAMQTFLNIAVVTGLFPTTGVSLPFFSFGGTALFGQLVEAGIVLSVSRLAEEK